MEQESVLRHFQIPSNLRLLGSQPEHRKERLTYLLNVRASTLLKCKGGILTCVSGTGSSSVQ